MCQSVLHKVKYKHHYMPIIIISTISTEGSCKLTSNCQCEIATTTIGTSQTTAAATTHSETTKAEDTTHSTAEATTHSEMTTAAATTLSEMTTVPSGKTEPTAPLQPLSYTTIVLPVVCSIVVLVLAGIIMITLVLYWRFKIKVLKIKER